MLLLMESIRDCIALQGLAVHCLQPETFLRLESPPTSRKDMIAWL